MSLTVGLADAYSSAGAAWQRGPGLVYDRLADRLVDACPVAIAGGRVLDLGAGTGAATRAAAARGAEVVVAVDVAIGMLAAGAASRAPAVVGDALALPFRHEAFDVVVAAFSLNHLTDPIAGLREAARVTRSGGAIVAAAYAIDDHHPARDAAEAAALARGWVPPPWYASIREDAVPLLATVERAASTAHHARLADVEAANVRVSFPDLGPAELVSWRLGMAQVAPFVASLSATEAEELVTDAVTRLGDAPVLERSVIVLTARVR